MQTISKELAIAELKAIQAKQDNFRYKRDPVAWVKEKLGDNLWSLQADVIRSVRDNRRTAVKSCHEVGKSFIASCITGWWLDTNKPGEAFVVTSAPSGPQVKSILWREIGRVHARGNLPGRVNQTEWLMRMPKGNEEQVAFGRKPDDYDPTAFQGIHAPKVLYIFDEACGIPVSLWEAADSLIANDDSKALVIGNPDDPLTEFAEVCKPGSGWNVIEIGAFQTPNFTGEPMPEFVLKQLIGRTYVEEKRRKWAPTWRWSDDGSKVIPPEDPEQAITNPLWQSKILGKFPDTSNENGLLPIHWVRAAMDRTLVPGLPVELGVDVGSGGDSSCGALRRGPVVRIQWEDHNPDTMQTCGNVVHHLKITGATVAKIDKIGIGKGVLDRGKELKLPFSGIGVGEKPEDEENFVNLRAELWWNVREMFEKGEIDIDPSDEDLAAELVSIRFKRQSNGKIQIESKDDAKKRGIPSPNRADALMLACAKKRKVLTTATWGR